jgi:protein TonB
LIPGYYRNPPPPYPAEARRLKQEGKVLLEVVVSAEGRVADLALKQSSGFPLLDEAALKAVRHWRFKPARLAGLMTQTKVQIPIRFELRLA